MATRDGQSASPRLAEYITIIYNLCNEPWIKYHTVFVADKGQKKVTSGRLKRGDVLYLENHSHRYELCFIREKVIKAESTSSQTSDSELSEESQSEESQNSNAGKDEIVDVYRFSRCKINFPQSTMLEKGIPLPVDVLEVIDDDLRWGNLLWTDTGVFVRSNEYKIVRFLYLSPTGVAPILP